MFAPFARAVACLALLLGASASASASTLESLGTDIAIALPVVAGGIAVYKDDWVGVGQLGIGTVATVGTAYGLKHVIREQRPDKSDYQSFPSDTVALSASGSAFLWARYGWRYGLPAFAATQFVSYSRVQADKHHWYDTLASSAMAAGYAYVFTTPFKQRYNINTSLQATPDSAFVQLSYNW